MNEAFERKGPVRRLIKRMFIDPLANYLPAGWLRGLLAFGKSELAAAHWADPVGWRSMVISYDDSPTQVADRILVGSGVMAMALRNRFRLVRRLLRDIINAGPPPVQVLCLGAGPGRITLDAMASASEESRATLVDLNPEAFDYGRQLAEQHGLSDRVRFCEGDVRCGLGKMLTEPPHVVKMIGLCEYLTDEQVVEIAAAAGAVMPAGAPIIFNNITRRHGNDRFLRRVFGLHMNHRSVSALTRLMAQAGFGDFDVHPEPLGVYNVIVGYRRGA